MNDIEILEKFKEFTATEKGRPCASVAIKDGIAYATDGRLAVASKLSKLSGDCVPDDYPITGLSEIVAKYADCNKWAVLDEAQFAVLSTDFSNMIAEERKEHYSSYKSRYHEFTCPCCGETLYLDFDDEEVVRYKPEPREFDARDVQRYCTIRFDDGRSVAVNFCYLYILVNAFGLGTNFIRIDIGLDRDGKKDVVYLKSPSGVIFGALMPVHLPHSGYPTDCYIDAHAI